METREFRIDRTRRRNLPALWEEGGGYTNTGYVTILAREDGGKPRATYIRRRGHLACGRHALVIVRPGMYVISANHHRGDFLISVYQIMEIREEEAVGRLLTRFEMGEWAPLDLPAHLEAAVEAARQKATDYHCRQPYYVET